MISSEEICFELFDDLKKKIRSSLISLKRRYERVKRNYYKLALFYLACSKEYIELSLKPKNSLDLQETAHSNQMTKLMTDLTLEKSQTIEVLFEYMNI